MKNVFRVFVLLWFPLQVWADLTVSVTKEGAGSIYPGQTTNLKITLGNSSDTASITGVNFNTSLPAGFPDGLKISGSTTYQCTDPSNSSISAGVGTLTAVIDSQSINLSGGEVPAHANNEDGECTILIPVTAGTTTGNTATYNYQIGSGVVSGTRGSSSVSNNGSVNQTISVLALTKPIISKRFTSSTVRLGDDPTQLKIQLFNSNSVAIPNFSITDTFPTLGGNAIIKVASPTAASASCTDGPTPTFSPVIGATSISATGDIPANGSCTILVNIEAASTNGLFSSGTQTNRITQDSDFTNGLGVPAANDATRNITVQSPLTVAKSFAHSVLSSGQTDSFTITLSNAANSPLTIGSFSDSPIDGTSGVGGGVGVLGSGLVATSGSTTCGGSVDIDNSGDGISLTGSNSIPANGACTITVGFTAAAQTSQVPVTYTNTIAAGAVNISSPTGITSQARSASVLVADELRVLKTASPFTAAPGNPIRYTVTVQNFSSSQISSVTIDDALPTGFTYLTGTINGNDFNPVVSANCGALTETSTLAVANAKFTIATLPARTSSTSPGACAVTFWAMVNPNAGDNASTVNTINANSVCYNSGGTCNGSSVSSSPSNARTEATVFSATKQFNGSTSPVTLSEGTIAKLSITLSNISANPLTNVTLSDTFPTDGTGQLQIASPANPSTTCGGTITAVPGTSSLGLNGATVPARESNGTSSTGTCVITVDVIGPAGTYNNTADLAGTQTYADNSTATISQFSTNIARLIYQSALSADKSFSPASVSSGGKSRVTVRLGNTGAVALTNVSMTDPLPSGMVLANPVNASTSCAGSPVFSSATAGSASITMQGANIAGSGSCDVLFDVIATGTSNWINTIPSGNITADGGVRNVNAVAATLNFDTANSISVDKATNPSTLTFPGQISELTITFTNGNTAVSNMAVTDYFTVDGTSGAPLNGMAISSTPNASTNCLGGVVSAVADGTDIGLSGVSLAAGAQCFVTVNVTSTAVAGITNFIPVSAITSDQGLTNTGQATTSITTGSNIGVVKKFIPNTIKPGERSRLRITFFNPTAQPMANVSVIDTLPTGVTVPSSPNPVTTCTGASVTSPASNKVQVSGGNITASSSATAQSCYAEIDVITTAQGEYVNTIPINAVTATAGGKPVKNSQPTSDTLRAKAPLVIHKAIETKTLDVGNPVGFSTGSADAIPGESATLTIRLDNANAQTLTSAAFTDSLPSNLVVAQTPNASSTCSNAFVTASASATQIKVTGATIPASGFCTVSVDVLSNISGNYINTIAAGEVTTDEGVTNEESTSAELIISKPPSVDKQFSPAVVSAGGISTLTIVFENDNTTDITLTSPFVDTLPTAPGNIVVASSPNKGGTCPGTVTANAGSGTVSYANGATIPAGGCTVNVDVTGNSTGEHINNIPAGDLKTSVGNNQQPANSTLLISPLGFISGKVFKDNNVAPNGTFDSGIDTAISGVSIELHSGANCSGTPIDTVITDSLGNYLFGELSAIGPYLVCQPTQPSGTNNGITTAGTNGTASNILSIPSQIESITLTDNGGGSFSGSANNNFAEVVPSTISGRIFLDQNNNGIQNGSDTVLASVSVELLNSSNAVIATVNTDANGEYSFTGLAPGTYSVREPNQPSGTANGLTVAGVVDNGGTAGTVTAVTTPVSQINSIILPPNTIAANNNFAEIPNGRRISGTVFLDYDNNGNINGPDHGIGGQTINLTGADINGNPVSLSTNTADDGSYSFTSIPEGTYTVTEPSQPTGTSNGITTVGSLGGTATNVSTTPSAISNIDLTGTNTVSGDNNFAEKPDGAADLAVTKTHSPASFGEGSNTGFYTISPSNIGTLASSGTITVVDTLPAGITAHAWPTSGDWQCNVLAQTVTCTSDQVITENDGVGSDIILRVAVANGLSGQILTNHVQISGGNEPPGFDGNNQDDDPVTIAESASVNGTVWQDNNHDKVKDLGEDPIDGWLVELLLDGQTLLSTTTDSNGSYAFTGLAPGSGYRVVFKEPTTGSILGRPVTNESGSNFTNGVVDETTNPAGADNADGSLNNLTLLAGTNTPEQSLPLDPAGVVYDSVTRQPITGATVALQNGGTTVATNCLVGGTNPQITGALGFYQFLLVNPAPVGCPGDGIYTLQVTQPSGYLPPVSTIIPESVPSPHTPIANISGTLEAIQSQATPPIGTQATTYYLGFNLTLTGVGVVNNHIPLDPVLGGAIAVTKTTPKRDVMRGGLVPYTITATNTLTAVLSNISLQDQIPAGFKYVDGSARLDGVSVNPIVDGRSLSWEGLTFTGNSSKTIQLILIVGSGVSEGDYVNQAWAFNSLADARVSNVGSATVRVIPDPLFDCSDLIGKVFDDKNINGYQDEGEPGLAGVRVVTVRGLLITTDDYGRFHLACADVPNELHGSNFMMKLDTRTLPSGYRVTTENPRVVRLTRGKLVKLNFGAALHRMLRIDLDQSAFNTEGDQLSPAANEQLTELVEMLKQQPSQMRLSYAAQAGETESDAKQRMQLFADALTEQWQQCDCDNYALTIEQEVLTREKRMTPESATGRVR